jgi:late competence protein required for DNA uptake (superfamily II DNA/RNA helicase)
MQTGAGARRYHAERRKPVRAGRWRHLCESCDRCSDKRSQRVVSHDQGETARVHAKLVGLKRVCSFRVMVMKKHREAVSQERIVWNGSLKELFLHIAR